MDEFVPLKSFGLVVKIKMRAEIGARCEEYITEKLYEIGAGESRKGQYEEYGLVPIGCAL